MTKDDMAFAIIIIMLIGVYFIMMFTPYYFRKELSHEFIIFLTNASSLFMGYQLHRVIQIRSNNE